MMDFLEELRWRGMIHDIKPGTEEILKQGMVTAYIGFDPTADSLHVGGLVPVMILKLFQMCGHKPLALVGGATGMIGDPSGKSAERNLLSEEVLRLNQEGIRKQLEKFLDFNCGANSAEIVNNYDWTKDFTLISFLREIGKHITVNYMLAKDSVQKRLETGLSFTEFSYQLIQGYDFLHLYQNKNCKLQMGGSDQWGNITTGTELIRRVTQGEAFAITCPLITKSDGSKFGKSEGGNVWLDARYTSPYKFYQFWINISDEDAEKYIKMFTLLNKETIEKLAAEHKEAPHKRILQSALAKEVTIMVHGDEEYNTAVEASQILFGKNTQDLLSKLDEHKILSVLDGVKQFQLDREELEKGINIVDLLAEKTQVFGSKGECRRMIKENGLRLNQVKAANQEELITTANLINNRYILVQKGKKDYFLLTA